MKETILNEAALLIRQYGIRKFTIDEIAAALRISKKTIYRYFKNKDDIIRCYIESSVSSDHESVTKIMKECGAAPDKMKAVIHSVHTYPLPVDLLNEVKQFYPALWKQIEDMKQFKTDAIKKICRQGIREHLIRSDISWPVLARMVEEITNMFTDYEFLAANGMRTSEAIDRSLDIILYGIMKNYSDSQDSACSTRKTTMTPASAASGISPSTNDVVPSR